MKGLEILDTLRNTIEAAGEPVSVTFTYAMLNEMARMVEYCEKYKGESPETLMPLYLYIADEYMYQRHFLFAREYYNKILALSENCPDSSDKAAIIEKCRSQLRRIDSKEDGLTENDPVEYTEKYLKILIELEAKIEEALRGEPMGDGFCYEYWSVKKRILKEDYGIRWESPGVLNDDVHFD